MGLWTKAEEALDKTPRMLYNCSHTTRRERSNPTAMATPETKLEVWLMQCRQVLERLLHLALEEPLKQELRELGETLGKVAAEIEQTDTGRRADWERVHAQITDAFMRLFVEQKRPPTQNEVAAACGISRSTVARHAEELELPHVLPELKLRTQRVLHGLAARAEKGYAREVEVFLALAYQWAPKVKVEHSGNIEHTHKFVNVRELPSPVLEQVVAGIPLEQALAQHRN